MFYYYVLIIDLKYTPFHILVKKIIGISFKWFEL